MLAAGSGLDEVVKYLIQHNADPAPVNKNGHGILYRAKAAGGKGNILYRWLLANCPTLQPSKGRSYRGGTAMSHSSSSSGWSQWQQGDYWAQDDWAVNWWEQP